MSGFKLRPHHGLCIQFFEGKGYSDSFISNMNNMIDDLNDTTSILITMDMDYVCACCPNNNDQICKTQEKVLRFDEKVAELCRLKAGQCITYSEFRKIIIQNVILDDKMKTVCKECKWAAICFRKADNYEISL